MKKISSGSTFMIKKVFPVFWFGFIVVFLLTSLTARMPAPEELIFFLVPCLMGIFGFFLFRKLLWDLADEVHDHGDYLVVRRGSETETIRIDNIMNVSASTNINPPRITLRLATPGRFGNEISFSPIKPFSLNMFAKNPIAEDLIVRVDAARRVGARR